MRGAHQHAFVAFDESVDLAGHAVKVLYQIGDFVAAFANRGPGSAFCPCHVNVVGGSVIVPSPLDKVTLLSSLRDVALQAKIVLDALRELRRHRERKRLGMGRTL